MQEHLLYWMALTRVEGIGLRYAHRLIERFGSPEAVYHASLTELEACGLRAVSAQALSRQEGLEEARNQLSKLEKTDYQAVTFSDVRYPKRLREMVDPPLVLYVRGSVEALDRCAVAIVGTRRPTAYGSSVTHRLAHDLARRNLVIVSGLARGIDSAAHRGALEAEGTTVAVLGSGLDVIYPKENKSLADKITCSGALISELPLGTPPVPENFPIRNRIICGLALGTVVTEGAEYSGSLITARLAADHNREVFAVPGNITSGQSFGPNHLGSVNTNGHNHVTMRRWNSRKLNTNGSRHTCRCSAATSAFRTSRCSTPSCMSPSMAANGAGYPHGLATGTPSTPA